MKTSRQCVLAAVLALAISAPSCRLFRRSAKTLPPAPPPPVVTGTETQPQVSLPNPPQLPPESPGVSGTHGPAVQAKVPPPPPKPEDRQKGRKGKKKQQQEEAAAAASAGSAQTAPPAAAEPAPGTAPPGTAAPQTAAVPQLEQLLTPEQQQAYNQSIDANISRAQRALAQLNGHKLSSEQNTYLARIHAFISQAAEARKTDLFRAKNLSERASVLAEDLLRSFQ